MTAGPTASDPLARGHIPVLRAEVLGALDPSEGQTALDCTAGLGGHSGDLALRLGGSGRLILNDADEGNLARAEAAVRARIAEIGAACPAIVALRGNFADAPRALAARGLRADAALADLGFASSQMEDAARGLSFSRPGPLDMRFDRSAPMTAATLVNTLEEREIEEILRDFGEEREARRIARAIIRERAAAPIETTDRLASIIRAAIGPGGGGPRIDPATRTFQALRIAVNDELGSLSSLLESVTRAATALSVERRSTGDAASPPWLAPGARVAVISFHSLEDRLVKSAWGELVSRGIATLSPKGVKQPVTASEAEQETNPRSRSAKLRTVEVGGMR